MTEERSSRTPFPAYIELLRLFLAQREEIVERVEAVLNAQRKPIGFLQDRALLCRHFEDCFSARTEPGQNRVLSELEEAHWSAGFLPRQVHYAHNDLIHPAEMTVRAFHCWQQTRWPGRNGRVHYAHTLFNLHVLRFLQLLSMRLWDEDPDSAGGRLTEIQSVLDDLWKSSPVNQAVFVRDARWLIPLAQSLITDELAPYFEVAHKIAQTLPEADRLEVQKAHVRMLGGHLASQIYYYSTKDGVPIDDASVVLRTRTSNALDFALLVQGLVTLLRAYECAMESGDEPTRLEIAGAICQGISADPELFLNRVDLLSAYSMIEHVFVSPRDAVYTSAGERHVGLLKEYGTRIHRLIDTLRIDLPQFRPVEGACSPFGVIFGLPSHLIEHMALKAMQHDAENRFSIEDIFDDGGDRKAKLAWVNGWRDLPHIDPAVQRLYDYPQQFAEQIYGRIERKLASGSSNTGRLHIVSGDGEDPKAQAIPELPARYFVSGDRAQLLRDRQEAHFLISYETPGGWVALKKELLTEVLATGGDARIAGLPPDAAQRLRLMCLDLAS